MRPDAILVNELQLGDALSQAVHQDRRGDFGLLLSMMVQDVRYHSQFQLEKDAEGENISLRQKFELDDVAPLRQEYKEAERVIASAEAFHQGGLVQSRLQECLSPQPLELQGRHPHGMQQALSNAEPWSQRSRQLSEQMKTLPPQMDLADLIAQQRHQSQALQITA